MAGDASPAVTRRDLHAQPANRDNMYLGYHVWPDAVTADGKFVEILQLAP